MTTAVAIDITAYLDADEMKQIARDTFAQHCLQKFRDDHERIFSNAAHHIVLKLVNEAVDGKAMELVAENTKRCIKQLSPFTVFGRKGVYDRDNTEGYKLMVASVKKHAERVENRVAAMIDTISKDDVLNAIMDGDISLKLARQ